MDADIKLSGDQVTIEGRVIRAEATDLMLGNLNVGGNASVGGGFTVKQEMTVGGNVTVSDGDVAVNGELNVNGRLTASNAAVAVMARIGIVAAPKDEVDLVCRGRGLRVSNPAEKGKNQGRALAQTKGDVLVVNEDKSYGGGVRIDGPVVMTGDLTVRPGKIIIHDPAAKPLELGNLIDIVFKLRSKVADLEAKVAKLEKKK